jgi:LuxR family maltose regulon positive regulatory protein
MRGYLAVVQPGRNAEQNRQRGLDLLEAALAILPGEDPHRGLVLFSLGELYLRNGHRSKAGVILSDAVEFNRRNGYTMMVILSLGGVADCQMLEGKLRAAAATCREGITLTERQGVRLVVSAANLHARLSMCHYEWNDLDTALEHALVAQEIARAGDYRIHLTMISNVLAQILQAQGDLDGARAAMLGADRLVLESTNSHQLRSRLTANRIRRHLPPGSSATEDRAGRQPLSGDFEWAQALGLSANDEPSAQHELEYLALARMLMSTVNRRGDGLRLLDRLLKVEEASGSTGLVISILALEALGLASHGDRTRALAALQRALTLAEPEGYIRTFVDEGPPMQGLLWEAKSRGIAPAYIGRLLSHFQTDIVDRRDRSPGSASRKDVDALTPRELEVLALIARGASNRDIAEALIVTVGTVKRHTNSLYSKLGAGSRMQAVARAHELHLL